MNGRTLLEARDIVKKFPVRKRSPFERRKYFTALKGVSFGLVEEEILSVVGESGSGKTTLAKTVLGIEKPQSGGIFFRGKNLAELKGSEAKKTKRKIQAVFQDPYSSLNPRMTVGNIIAEPLRIAGITEGEIRKKLPKLLDMVSLPGKSLEKYPHEFSGGQRQRIAIARAVAPDPEIIIADEPVSSLDISIQAQILNLLSDLRKEIKLSYIFISHDMAVVRHISDRVMVMNGGEAVETAPVENLFDNPLHPYTRILLESVPRVGEKPGEIIIRENPVPENPKCGFAGKCPEYDREICESAPNEFKETEPRHYVRCIRRTK